MSEPDRPEFALIDWIRRRTGPAPGVLLGPGDDCAELQFPPGSTLVTSDMFLEGSCFILAQAGAKRVGRKAMSANLSDMAAMAGTPRFAVVAVGLPRAGGRAVAEELYLGMREVADAFETAIVGGDTNTWDGPLVVSITLMGDAPAQGAARRSGARLADWIFVTGKLGGSILGKHLDFTPRVREALVLHDFVDLHAMIDISDGLGADLHHICAESGCGAILHADRIPISAEAHILSSRDGCPALEHALGDGEDFELLFTVSPEEGRRLLAHPPIAGLELSAIGQIVAEGVWLETSGKLEELPPLGYVHGMH